MQEATETTASPSFRRTVEPIVVLAVELDLEDVLAGGERLGVVRQVLVDPVAVVGVAAVDAKHLALAGPAPCPAPLLVDGLQRLEGRVVDAGLSDDDLAVLHVRCAGAPVTHRFDGVVGVRGAVAGGDDARTESNGAGDAGQRHGDGEQDREVGSSDSYLVTCICVLRW